MSELQYQLDLLKAMNQKLSVKERMYRMVCDHASNAFLYYSFDKDEWTTLGKWDEFFKIDIKTEKDLNQLFDVVEENQVLPLRESLFVEKTGMKYAEVECKLSEKNTWYNFQVQVIYDENKNPTDKIVTIDDITTLKVKHAELTYLAYYDGLTGLYNRNYFVRRLGEFVRKASETEKIVSVVVIDIDDFKKVNDGLGIVVGDELIQQFGSFLGEFANDNVIVSHFTSDVYCMAVYDPSNTGSVNDIYEKIQSRTKEDFRLSGGRMVQMTVSMGVASYPEASTSALELINCAEIVMFKGKNMGKNTIQYFDTPTIHEFIANIEMENKLKEAVNHNGFELYFQPQFYSRDKKLRGMEALIRWKDGNNGMVSPSTFIPIAEKTGSIIPIGNWVVERSVSQYAEWYKKYGLHFILSINISALQCSKDDFVGSIIHTIEKYGVNPAEIELEITESILISDFEEVSEKLNALRNYGIRISLDDFGTGFSSLSYLKKLPIDTLKIDKSFIDTVLTDSATRIITESIISMVKTLGFESVAEGVEEGRQHQYLKAVGCDVIQGYYFGKPLPVEEIEKLLQSLT